MANWGIFLHDIFFTSKDKNVYICGGVIMDDEDFDDDQEHEQEFVSATTSNRDPDRIFCPRCTNMWGPWEDRQQNLLMLKCNSCGHMERADNTKPVHQNFVVKQMQYVFF